MDIVFNEFVVEGEKTADAAQHLLPHAIATTWIGGANGIQPGRRPPPARVRP